MPANLEKDKNLTQASSRAWNWLQGLDEYKKDFSFQQKQIRSGNLPKFSANQNECEADCHNDKKNPGYYYSNPPHFKKEPYDWEMRDSFKGKWGFYPLQSPSVKSTPAALYEFIRYISNLPRVNELEKALLQKCDGWNQRELDKSVRLFNATSKEIAYVDGREKEVAAVPPAFGAGRKKEMSNKLYVEVDLDKNFTQIAHDLSNLVKDARKKYSIQEKRLRLKDVDKRYRGYVKKKLGEKSTATALELYSNLGAFNEIEKARKRLSRQMEKIPKKPDD